MKRSCIIDLRRPGCGWEYPETSLPEKVHAPTSELFTAIDLPNASLNADALVSKARRQVAGITVRVDDDDWQDVQELFAAANSSLVEFYGRNERQVPSRYSSLLEWNWAEVRWASSDDLYVDEILTNCAVWYSVADSETSAPRIAALGIEDVGYFLSEIGEGVSLAPFRGIGSPSLTDLSSV